MILLIFFLYIHICVYLYKLSQLKFQSNSIKLLKVPQLNDVVKGDQTWQCSLSSREVSYRLSSWAKWLRNPHVLQGFKHIWWISEPSPVLVILPSSSPLMSPVWTPNLSFNKSQLSPRCKVTKQIFWEENIRKTKRPKRLQKFQRLILHIRHDFAMPENHLSLQPLWIVHAQLFMLLMIFCQFCPSNSLHPFWRIVYLVGTGPHV